MGHTEKTPGIFLGISRSAPNRGGGCSQSVEAVGGQSAGRESACLSVTLLLLEPYIARHFWPFTAAPGQPDTAATPKLTITP